MISKLRCFNDFYMNRAIVHLAILLVILIIPTLACAQKVEKKTFFSHLGFTPLDDTVVHKKSGLLFAPIAFYTPDTRWALGGVALSAFHLKDKNDSTAMTRMSYVKFIGYYTLNNQFDTWTAWNIFTPSEKYLFKGELRFRRYPDRFYGIGNNTLTANEEKYSYDLLKFKTLFLKKVRERFFLGFDYQFEKEYNFKLDPDGQLQNESIPGYNGGIGSALGLVSVYDTRDNVLNAYKGVFAEFSSYFNSSYLGSTFSFTELNGTYQQYWQFRPKHILAWETRARFTFGETPFLDMSTLGGDDILRGYPQNRFRDNHFAATQVEYRFPLFWRFRMTTFVGVGDIFSDSQDLSWQRLKYSVGTGLRFIVNSSERVNLRLDYGYGTQGGYFYFGVSEAF